MGLTIIANAPVHGPRLAFRALQPVGQLPAQAGAIMPLGDSLT